MDKGVQDYFAAVPQPRKQKVDTLHRLIMEMYPRAIVDMKYRMPTYRFGDGWVAIANQKNYVSLYTCGYHHIERFRTKNPAIKTGKGCINFRDRDQLPLQDIKAVIRHAIDQPKDSLP
ncbi:MAG: DUF1801 domain-containing protein [Gammaproteobacteria bacterium]|nr:DUF1801 domain-containing protein [Gammaproteobacteria bacterium]MDH3535139.1 DUF1801 domain-containing protein [Gammaproteobacteria bacterium]